MRLFSILFFDNYYWKMFLNIPLSLSNIPCKKVSIMGNYKFSIAEKKGFLGWEEMKINSNMGNKSDDMAGEILFNADVARTDWLLKRIRRGSLIFANAGHTYVAGVVHLNFTTPQQPCPINSHHVAETQLKNSPSISYWTVTSDCHRSK